MAFDLAIDRGAAYRSGALALFIATAGILTALGFQYIGGYVPCQLCLEQRYAYYVSIPLLFVALALSSGGKYGWASALFFAASLLFLANAGLGTYHAGVEWKFWPGPEGCSGTPSISTNAGDLLKSLPNTKIVSCSDAALRFLGLSFAGWNAVASLLLMLLALRTAFAASEARSTL